jgi:hypothetical protein
VRAGWAQEARIAEVRRAARGWREAEVIDAATLHAIETAYPDPRPRVAPAWKALIFFLTTVAIHAVFFGFVMVVRSGFTVGTLGFGLFLAIATEKLRSSTLAGNGSDAAASFAAILHLLLGSGLLWTDLEHSGTDPTVTVLLALATVLFAAACVHWGYSVHGAFAAISFFLLLARVPGGRVWWILVGAGLTAAAYRRLDRSDPPPLRRAAAAVLAVSAIAVYVAINRYSLDHHWIESVEQGYRPLASPAAIFGILSAAATALVPILFLAWGVRARRTLILDLGLLFMAASLVTLRAYVHLAPLWALLTLVGTALVLGALALNRHLRRGTDGERNGFTAAPLYSGRRAETVQTAAVLAGFASAPAPARSGELETGGGGFGGGGASGQF